MQRFWAVPLIVAWILISMIYSWNPIVELILVGFVGFPLFGLLTSGQIDGSPWKRR